MTVDIKKIAKGAIDIMTGIGIGIMVKTGAAKLTPENAGRITKVCCKLGGVVIASAIGRAASKEIDNIENEIMQIRDAVADNLNHQEGNDYVEC